MFYVSFRCQFEAAFEKNNVLKCCYFVIIRIPDKPPINWSLNTRIKVIIGLKTECKSLR